MENNSLAAFHVFHAVDFSFFNAKLSAMDSAFANHTHNHISVSDWDHMSELGGHNLESRHSSPRPLKKTLSFIDVQAVDSLTHGTAGKKSKLSSVCNMLSVEDGKRAVQEHENELAELVVVCEPEQASLMMGGLHPRGSLYERPINIDIAKAQHAEFRHQVSWVVLDSRMARIKGWQGCFCCVTRPVLLLTICCKYCPMGQIVLTAARARSTSADCAGDPFLQCGGKHLCTR